MFGLSELAVLLIVAIVVIAARKAPELARSAGRATRIFKKEVRAARTDDEPAAPSVTHRTDRPGTPH